MKMKIVLALLLTFSICQVNAQRIAADKIKTKNGEITIQPVTHASFVLSYKDKTIYVDPTGGQELYNGLATPDIILVTDIHGDHLDPKTIQAVNTKAIIVAPQAVAEKLTTEKPVVIKNGEKTDQVGISITAVPMYNLPEAADAPHIKGRGNGYVLTIDGTNIYISGDTEDIPEMRDLKNIDVAFVCMNLPYTMDVNQAASGVLAFKPKIVYPYHYRGQDTNAFKSLVNAGDAKIDVRLRNWYATPAAPAK